MPTLEDVPKRKTIDKRISRAAARARQKPDDADVQDALQQAWAERAAFYKVHRRKTPGPLPRYLQARVEITPANASDATESDRSHE